MAELGRMQNFGTISRGDQNDELQQGTGDTIPFVFLPEHTICSLIHRALEAHYMGEEEDLLLSLGYKDPLSAASFCSRGRGGGI